MTLHTGPQLTQTPNTWPRRLLAILPTNISSFVEKKLELWRLKDDLSVSLGMRKLYSAFENNPESSINSAILALNEMIGLLEQQILLLENPPLEGEENTQQKKS